jgi:hypothetical protein
MLRAHPYIMAHWGRGMDGAEVESAGAATAPAQGYA